MELKEVHLILESTLLTSKFPCDDYRVTIKRFEYFLQEYCLEFSRILENLIEVGLDRFHSQVSHFHSTF